MNPQESAIRALLRREAAQVPIPEDMWEHISRRMDQERAAAERRKRQRARLERWKPAIGLAAAFAVSVVFPFANPTRTEWHPPASRTRLSLQIPSTMQDIPVDLKMEFASSQWLKGLSTATPIGSRINTPHL